MTPPTGFRPSRFALSEVQMRRAIRPDEPQVFYCENCPHCNKLANNLASQLARHVDERAVSTAHEGSNKPFWVGINSLPTLPRGVRFLGQTKRFELISPGSGTN